MLRRILVLGPLVLSVSCSPDHGPHWEDRATSPEFSIQTDNVSTTFEGFVSPETTFLFGPREGVSFTTGYVQLTIDAAAVWAYAPIHVDLYAGEEHDVGDPDALVASFTVREPEPGGHIKLQESQPLGRTPQWIRVEFEDFAGQCVLQLLGHHGP